MRIELSDSARRVLRDRTVAGGEELLLIHPGPAHENYQGIALTSPGEVTDSPPRWLLAFVPAESFESRTTWLVDMTTVEVEGMKALVLFPPKDSVLRLELIDNAICVFESAAPGVARGTVPEWTLLVIPPALPLALVLVAQVTGVGRFWLLLVFIPIIAAAIIEIVAVPLAIRALVRHRFMRTTTYVLSTSFATVYLLVFVAFMLSK